MGNRDQAIHGQVASRGFYSACDDLQPNQAFVVHTGDDRFPVSASVEAIGLRELAGEIRRR